MKTSPKKTATNQRPSPPSKKCTCARVKDGAASAHKRTCPDYTEEDAAWCVAQWSSADRALAAWRDGLLRFGEKHSTPAIGSYALPAGAALADALAMGAKLGVVVQIPREKLHGQDPVEVAQFMAALVANGWTPEVR